MPISDDCETVLRILADATGAGFTMEEIGDRTGWRRHYVNAVLTPLVMGRQVRFMVVRERGKKVTRYALETRRS